MLKTFLFILIKTFHFMEQEQNAFEQDLQNAAHNEDASEQTQEVEHNQPFNPLRNYSTLIGFGVILITLICFFYSIKNPMRIDIFNNGVFFVAHAPIIIYFIHAFFRKKEKTAWYPTRVNSIFLLLVAFQIGSFLLNLDFQIFPESVGWLQVVLTLHGLTLIALTFRDYLSEKVLNGLYFIMGVGLIVDLYFTFFTLPLASVGLIGIWFFGFSIYAWSPVLKVVYSIGFFTKSITYGRYFSRFYACGIAFALSIVLIFNLGWFNLVKKVNTATGDTKSELPQWVRIAQVLPPSVLTEKLLKSNIRGGSFMFGFEGIGDRWHDPLVVLGNAISPMPHIEFEDRAKILKTVFNDRHDAERRLWNGDNLRTSNVDIAIEMLPKQRIAYTEQTLTIENTISKDTRWATQEAIYIFKMPEGGVVTSLSLWINGKEEKGYLTSKNKADSAYATIVGRENRDPSVVHWREGNTVSVRVFPCTPEDKRKVKIGFTTPMRFENNQLMYENILFDGPPALSATTHTYIYGVEKVASEVLDFDRKEKALEYVGKYKNDGWSCTMDCPPLANDVFSFDNASYHVSAYTPQYEAFELSEIYLDINKSWKNDFDEIWDKVKNKTVYAFCNNEMTQLNEGNIKTISRALLEYNFSIFPIEKVKNANNALIITQNNTNTPDLTDIEKSESFKPYLADSPARVFSRGTTTYWNTLKQMRLVKMQQGTLSDLDRILNQKIFEKNQESFSKVVIESSKTVITQEPKTTESKATDHLFRLWAYNKIMTDIGINIIDKSFRVDSLIPFAEKANIVTPVSSLIVLEKQEDYDRFDIKRNGNALGNATLNNSGAAPEPHEWALIFLGLGIVLWTIRKRIF
jgi:XrtN system VIT domain protein